MGIFRKVLDGLNKVEVLTRDLQGEYKSLILDAEKDAKQRAKKVNNVAESLGVHITLDESYNMTKHVQDLTGLYLKPSYNRLIEKYTCYSTGPSTWYAVRDQFYYYCFTNGEIKKIKSTGVIKLKANRSNLPFSYRSELYHKEFGNGKVEIHLTEEDLEEYLECQAQHKLLQERLTGR